MKKTDHPKYDDALNSSDLASLIVDALLRGGILSKVDVKRALEIVTEEIEVRKALGDY